MSTCCSSRALRDVMVNDTRSRRVSYGGDAENTAAGSAGSIVILNSATQSLDRTETYFPHDSTFSR